MALTASDVMQHSVGVVDASASLAELEAAFVEAGVSGFPVVEGGRVVGASDEKGATVAERPVYPCDVLRSMYKLLGIDPDGPMPNPRGLDVKVLPVDEVAESGGLLKEIM